MGTQSYFEDNKILMFMRTLKVFKKQNKAQLIVSHQRPCSPKKYIRKRTISSIQSLSETNQKLNTQFHSEEETIPISNAFRLNKSRLVNFQNQYIKAQAKKQSILDERKQCIKEKIKDKVKEQLAELVKRSQTTSRSAADMKIKGDFIRDCVLHVEIKGSPLKKSLRTSVTERPELVKLQKIRKSNMKKHSLRQPLVTEKPGTTQTVECSARSKGKGRRSLSNIIRLQEIKQEKTVRNSHSALEQLRSPAKKDSVQIEPWNYMEDY